MKCSDVCKLILKGLVHCAGRLHLSVAVRSVDNYGVNVGHRPVRTLIRAAESAVT